MLDKKFSSKQLNQCLNSLLVLGSNTATSTIYNVLVSWVQRTYKNKEEYEGAYNKFLSQTDLVIHREPGYSSWGEVQLRDQKEIDPQYVATELSALLDQFSTENALEFLSELTGTCFLRLAREDKERSLQDEKYSVMQEAEGLFSWLSRVLSRYYWE
jgi:hypothetical protein